jgi:myo-inositol-1(or 4)-monophosphatase
MTENGLWFEIKRSPELQEYGLPMQTLIRAIYDAGETAKNTNRTSKEKSGEGHRSVITEADTAGQAFILDAFPKSLKTVFICEEDASDPRVLPKENVGDITRKQLVVIDPIDGTAPFAHGQPGWAVAGGLVENFEPVGSVIYAPDANDGSFLVSYKKRQMQFSEHGSKWVCVGNPTTHKRKESLVLLGADTLLYRNAAEILPKLAASTRSVATTGSGLFGLMQVALGRASVVIQTPQKVWDWIPLYHAVVSAGRTFAFFRFKDKALVELVHFDERSFNFPREDRLGFVAGEPEMVEWIMNKLPRDGWERVKV